MWAFGADEHFEVNRLDVKVEFHLRSKFLFAHQTIGVDDSHLVK